MQQLRFYSPQWLYSESKAIAENKNAIVASCWTYFTTMTDIYSVLNFTVHTHFICADIDTV